MKIELYQSPVVFSENPHGYQLHGKRMSGITSLIRDVLGLGTYPEASDYARDYMIPRAGEYGSSVHHAIEAYDKHGVKVTLHPKSSRYRNPADPDDIYWDVADELETYIAHRQGYEAIANEYTVSDEVRYASNIDNVWRKVDDGGIWLVDTKTNNLRYYHGGEDGLKEYLSWQLSIYALLFERQNPTIKVAGLACNWLRSKEGAFWEIERKPDDDVELLLSVTWMWDQDAGKIVYFGDLVRSMLTGAQLEVSEQRNDIVPYTLVEQIHGIARQADEARRQLDELKRSLRDAMEGAGVKSWDSGLFKATIAADSVSDTFDTVRFRSEHPELYKQYLRQTCRKGGITIKLRDE